MFDENSYLCYKLCQLILADVNSEELVMYNPSISSFDFLSLFLIFISAFSTEESLSPYMKKNALNYLNIVRFSDNIDSDRINLINMIIRTINSQNGHNYIDYYRQELYKRTNNLQYLIYPVDSFVDDNEMMLIDSIKFDYLVLLSHSNAITEDDFNDNFLLVLLGDLRYFGSINCILEEYPEKFNDSLFYQRYEVVVNNFLKLQNNKQGYNSIKKFDNKIKKLRSYSLKN